MDSGYCMRWLQAKKESAQIFSITRNKIELQLDLNVQFDCEYLALKQFLIISPKINQNKYLFSRTTWSDLGQLSVSRRSDWQSGLASEHFIES